MAVRSRIKYPYTAIHRARRGRRYTEGNMDASHNVRLKCSDIQLSPEIYSDQHSLFEIVDP